MENQEGIVTGDPETASGYPIITIQQGRANHSPYFHIIQPVPGKEFHKGQEIHCIHPKTKHLTRGIITGNFWTFPWSDPPKGLILREWGVEPGLLYTALRANDPSFEADDWARIIQIKEI